MTAKDLIVLIAGSALIVLGLAFFTHGERRRRAARTTVGRVVSSDVAHVSQSWRPEISYRYWAEGAERSSRQLTPPPGRSGGTGPWARRMCRRYPEGAGITVYYVPDDPDTAFLINRPSLIWFIPVTLGVGLFVIGITGSSIPAS